MLFNGLMIGLVIGYLGGMICGLLIGHKIGSEKHSQFQFSGDNAEQIQLSKQVVVYIMRYCMSEETKMTYEQAIEILKDAKMYVYVIEVLEVDKALDDPNQKCMESLEMAIDTLKKQIPKKVIYTADGYADGHLCYDYAKCPTCGNDEYEEGINNWGEPYCPKCGQALDWSMETEEDL